MIVTEFPGAIALRMRTEHATLAARWFERLLDIVPTDAAEVFPSATLLDHIPALIEHIASSLAQAEPLAANTMVLEKARELGALRHDQRASLHQVLREYQLLAAVLVGFVREEVPKMTVTPPPLDVTDVVSRLHGAADVLMQTTVETFVDLYTRSMAEQAARLEEFTRMATHEWRQPLGALHFGLRVLAQEQLAPADKTKTLAAMDRSIQHLVEMTRKLERVARLRPTDDPVVQEISATSVAREAARQLADTALERGVTIVVDDGLPTLVVDTGRLELAFLNLISNAVKYADPQKVERLVHVGGRARDDGHCELIVQDNGLGIPAERVASIFERFTRAHRDDDVAGHVSGLGLGLAIVADCVRSMGGKVHVSSVEGAGTTFTLVLPSAAA